MSSRLERVHQALQAMGGGEGVSAQALAEVAGIDRSNASRELNRLVLAGLARKVPGKPVRFLPVPRQSPAVAVPDRGAAAPGLVPDPTTAATPPPAPAPAAAGGRGPLDGLCGAQGSLKGPIALAKAAILYPGGGLHTLILGPTGVGKSLFAEEMYRFAVARGVIPADAPFVIFNCADYASNPQLLLGQLFGAARGAYTGASTDRVGVAELASGGILFLDEIHRLPPEGQEMLFLLLDRGQLRRLGDTRLRSVRVRVIAATTEDPESSLLATFLRRIPMSIKLPALADRPADERLDLILHSFQAEADRVGMPIEVSGSALSRLTAYTPRGNIGQLKGDIQLACARAFLDEVLAHTGAVRVDEHSLPVLPEPGAATAPPLAGTYRFTPGADSRPSGRMGEAIYERIARRVRELEAEGRAAESGTLISAEIDEYFARVTDVDPAWQQAVERLIGEQVVSWAADMLALAREKLSLAIEPRARVGLAMHIASTLERMQQGKAINYPRLRELRLKYPKEVAAAAAMAARLEKLAGVSLPPDETGFLASFLLGVGGKVRGKVGVLVICHGRHTAQALVQTVRELVGDTASLAAVDWPVGEPLDRLLVRAEAELRTLDAGQGVLVLVDMGQLVAVGELLTVRTGIPTRTVDMVSTPRLLEAVRKARLPDMTLDDLARLVVEAPTFSRSTGRATTGVPVVLTLCLTGEGSARRLAAMLGQSLPELAEGGVEIVTGALSGERPAAELVASLLKERPVLAVVSTFDPGELPVAVVLLEDLLLGPGITRLRHLVAGLRPAAPDVSFLTPEREELLRQMTVRLASQMKAVEPARAVAAVSRALLRVEADLAVTLSLDLFAGMAMHLVCLVDELVGRKDGTPQPERVLPEGHVVRTLAASLGNLEQTFGIQIPSHHLERMALMIPWNGAALRAAPRREA